MKLFKKARKGFTLIELVVVIAVMAVLSAVAVVTYISITNKAKLSNDQLKVDQVNLSLTADETLNGKRKTVHETLQSLEDEGFRPENFTAESKGYQFVYVKELNKLALFKDGQLTYPKGVKANQKSDIYLFTGNGGNLKDGYSHYLTGENIEGEVQVNAGLDVGYNTKISSIDYDTRSLTEGQKVVVRSNSSETKITVNGPKDTLVHYGPAESVSVVDIASASYHENGEVKFFEASAGHIVLEKDAEVTAFHFVATNGEFKNADNKTISVDLSKVSEENMPAFSRDSVTIEENGTYVAEVKTDSTEYIWLFGNGIKEQMVATTSEGAIAENGTLKPGITTGAEDGSVAEQIANPAKRNDAGQLVDENDTVIDLTTVDFTKADALEDVEVVVEQVASKAAVETGATLFAGGTGTQSNPFLISNREELENIYMSHMTGYVGTYYKVKDGVNEIDCSNWTPIWIEANFDGNGVTLTNLDAPLFSFVGYNYDSPVFRNFNVVANMHYNDDRAAIITYNYAKTQVTLESVNVSGIIESSLGASTYFGYGKSTINLIDCISTANLVATGGGVSGIVNHPRFGKGTETYINIIDSAFVGSMSYKDGTPGYFGTNYWSAAVTVKYSNEFISKYGNPNGTLYNQPAGSTDENGVITFTGTNSMQYIASGKSATLTTYSIDLPNVGESFSVAKISGASKIVVTLEIGANDENGYGNYVATYEIEEIDVSGYDTGDTITTNKIKNFEIIVVPANNTDKVTGAAGATYYVVSGRNGSTYGSAVVRITQYDSIGNVIGISSVSIKK